MIKQYIITNCKKQITTTCLAMNTPFETVKALFQKKETTIIDYSNNTEKELMLETRFENATLTCLFDHNLICEGAFLLLDDINQLSHYIAHCSQAYPYNHVLKGWVNDNCFIQIHTENKECSLIVLPIKPTGL